MKNIILTVFSFLYLSSFCHAQEGYQNPVIRDSIPTPVYAVLVTIIIWSTAPLSIFRGYRYFTVKTSFTGNNWVTYSPVRRS